MLLDSQLEANVFLGMIRSCC